MSITWRGAPRRPIRRDDRTHIRTVLMATTERETMGWVNRKRIALRSRRRFLARLFGGER